MDKVKVGEYVRTKYGIAKYIDVEIKRLGIIVIDRYIAHDHTDDYKNVITPEEILKHSFNIIDLIEEGDYINGNSVLSIGLTYLTTGIEKHFKVVDCHGYFDILKQNDIKSIVTKEQFEAMEYEVK